jgi:hypothetical protein
VIVKPEKRRCAQSLSLIAAVLLVCNIAQIDWRRLLKKSVEAPQRDPTGRLPMDHTKRARRLWALALIAMFGATTWRSVAQSTQHELDNVQAFTRAYGVIRFFYPGDAAANADWNRLAVDGVARIRTARDSSALAARLRDIFEPLGPRIEPSAQIAHYGPMSHPMALHCSRSRWPLWISAVSRSGSAVSSGRLYPTIRAAVRFGSASIVATTGSAALTT